MPTLDQPLYCEGYCPKCERFFFVTHIGEEPRAIKHSCGQAIAPTWRRLVILDVPHKCLICGGEGYKEVTSMDTTGPKTEERTSDGQIAASFVIHNGKLTRHMCGIPLMKDGLPMTSALHPDVTMH